MIHTLSHVCSGQAVTYEITTAFIWCLTRASKHRMEDLIQHCLYSIFTISQIRVEVTIWVLTMVKGACGTGWLLLDTKIVPWPLSSCTYFFALLIGVDQTQMIQSGPPKYDECEICSDTWELWAQGDCTKQMVPHKQVCHPSMSWHFFPSNCLYSLNAMPLSQFHHDLDRPWWDIVGLAGAMGPPILALFQQLWNRSLSVPFIQYINKPKCISSAGI